MTRKFREERSRQRYRNSYVFDMKHGEFYMLTRNTQILKLAWVGI